MHSKRDNIEIITNDEGRKDIKNFFKSLKKIYQIKLECMKGSELVFSYVHLLYYKCHQVNLTISLNVLYAKTYPNYVSKHNSNHEKQVIILMIANGEGRYYLAWKTIYIIGIASKYHGDFYSLNCLHSFATENKCKSNKKACTNKDFCNIVMPPEDTKILVFNQNLKSGKEPFIIYADLNV